MVLNENHLLALEKTNLDHGDDTLQLAYLKIPYRTSYDNFASKWISQGLRVWSSKSLDNFFGHFLTCRRASKNSTIFISTSLKLN